MLNLRALRDLIRTLAHPCRANDEAIARHVAAALDPEWRAAPQFLDDYGYRTGRAATPADLVYHELMSEVVLDAANERWHECGGVLDPAWLLLDAPEGIDR